MRAPPPAPPRVSGNSTYVLDTNVLLHDPSSIFAFKENELVLPITVFEEIDRFKKDVNELGRNARSCSRILDQLRALGSLRVGITLPNGGRLRVEYAVADSAFPITWGPETNDNRILGCVVRLARELAPKRVVLVTRDTNMRLKCDALGVTAEDYHNAKVDVDEAYTGFVEIEVDVDLVTRIHSQKQHGIPLNDGPELRANQFARLMAAGRPQSTVLVRVDSYRGVLRLVQEHRARDLWGIDAKNKEQSFALDLLMDPQVNLVTLTGGAGTGKTLLALAAGCAQSLDAEARYRKLLVSRPIFPLGRDIGFLPGDVEQKLNPWMKPIFDNLELLVSQRDVDRTRREPAYQHLFDRGLIEVEPLTYIRGRSIPDQFLIVDEAQNLTPHEVKTVLTRAGSGTKVVLTGDVHQIDHPYVDAMSNGLTYAIERFKDQPLAGHVSLRKGERSPLAELAANVL